MIEIWMNSAPVETGHGKREKSEERKQNHVHQRPGGDTPEVCARTRRRFDKRNPAKRPKHNCVSPTSGLPTSEGMPKFVHQHDREERQIFQYCPKWVVIAVRKSSDFESCNNEPGKMQIHPYSCEAKDWKRAFHCQGTF